MQANLCSGWGRRARRISEAFDAGRRRSGQFRLVLMQDRPSTSRCEGPGLCIPRPVAICIRWRTRNNMRLTLRLTLAMALCQSLTGCGGSPGAVPPPAHNGTMISLPDREKPLKSTPNWTVMPAGAHGPRGVPNRFWCTFTSPIKQRDESRPTNVTVKVGSGSNGSLVLSPAKLGRLRFFARLVSIRTSRVN